MGDTRIFTKTRTGCAECKRKKIKCDEKKPNCTRCKRCPDRCKYELNLSWTGGRPFKKPRKSKVPQGDSVERSAGALFNAFLFDPTTGDDATKVVARGGSEDGDGVSSTLSGHFSSGFLSSADNWDMCETSQSQPILVSREQEGDDISAAAGDVGGDFGTDSASFTTPVGGAELMSPAESFELVHQLLNASGHEYVDGDDEAMIQALSDANHPSQILDHNPVALNHPLIFMPSDLLSSTESRFFLHHYHTYTSSVIFPLSPRGNPLRETLLQAAVTTPHLLSALLASACSHYTRLRGDLSPDMSKTIIKFTGPALAGLREAVSDQSSVHKMETISTALALCTSDVISGDLSMWRMHLQGVKNLLFSAIQRETNSEHSTGDGSSSDLELFHPRSLASTLTITDPTQLFLMKWFATLDIFAGVSGLGKSTIPDGHYWSSTTPDHCRGYVDEFMGCSLELMPLLAKIGRMARVQQKRAKIALAASAASRAMKNDSDPSDSEDQEAIADMHIRCKLRRETLEEIDLIESQLHALFERSAPPSLTTHHGRQSPSFSSFSLPPVGTSTQPSTSSPTTRIDVAEEMRLTHRIFVYAALLHLYRRVQNLPKSHIKPAHAVYMILENLEKLHADSAASILILWPVFSAGCETDDGEQRRKIDNRMKKMGRFGMGNVERARKAMRAYWDAEDGRRWDLFMEEKGWDIVLF
ncbi:hypothetical protein PV08_00023 [Exophiala spinifera]|uniref:Zn(2)-C6 fungal-type domain-containing protein n=1 Tax=Exophiala spinifera TaxID=91928 RepID=A0A0D1YW04_9EURO|nr:uncharacterized protein PV08_00023 [Exophiala spinifera]KIW19451.1 hypothetical protein PV08_00023 [Exophiala spinifera]